MQSGEPSCRHRRRNKNEVKRFFAEHRKDRLQVRGSLTSNSRVRSEELCRKSTTCPDEGQKTGPGVRTGRTTGQIEDIGVLKNRQQELNSKKL